MQHSRGMRLANLPSADPMRTDRGLPRRPAMRGYSILEILAVLVIIGVALTIAGVETMRALRRNALAAVAQTIQMQATRAFLESQRRGTMMFLRIGNATAGGPTVVQLWADDPNPGDPVGNPPGTLVMPPYGTVDPAKDTLVEEHRLDLSRLSLSTTVAGQIAAVNWSSASTDITVDHLLACDTFGRAVSDFSTAARPQNTAAATLPFTLPEMASGSLVPGRGFELRISPAWTVQLREIGF